MAYPLGVSTYDIQSLGRWVGFEKSDINYLKWAFYKEKLDIGGWVNRISYVDGPFTKTINEMKIGEKSHCVPLLKRKICSTEINPPAKIFCTLY